MPSKNVLEKICSEGENLLISYETYINSQEGSPDPVFAAGLFSKICAFYRIELSEINESRLSVQKVYNVYGEASKNCINHGSKTEEFSIGLFLGDLGVCYGFKDKGDYFKSEKIKHQYENKIKITEFNSNFFGETCHYGINDHIFPNSDLIEVDVEKGILYCVQFKENIIAPEGEEGNSYFFKRDGGKGF